MLSGGVIVASWAADDNGKTSSIAAVNIHFLGIILIMVTVPLFTAKTSLIPETIGHAREMARISRAARMLEFRCIPG
jgi:hypothetical protein